MRGCSLKTAAADDLAGLYERRHVRQLRHGDRAVQLPPEISVAAGLFLSVSRLQPGGMLLYEPRQSVSGIDCGRPLAAPFARPPVGAWVNLPADSVLSGVTNLMLQCTASASNHPIQQVDLFLDGTWLQTLTNIPPAAGNPLYVTINGCATNYTVQATPRLIGRVRAG